MVQEFDLVVIGTGAAGMSVAFECNASGWNVAIVDSRSFGGTCALRGCDPKKVLVGTAEAVDWSQRMVGKGIADKANIDWNELMEFKKTFTEPMPQELEKSFENTGITAFQGEAQFVDDCTLAVDGEHVTADRIVIATGAQPRPVSFPGSEHLVTSAEFLELDELPETIIFAGGGYISFEFAHVAARAGAEVTILHRSERPLKQFEPDLVDTLLDATEAAGIRFVNSTPVEAIEKRGDKFVVKSGDREFEADLVVHGAGRVPEIDNLALNNGNVQAEKGVKVNEYLQSVSNSHVYAAGDCAQEGLPPLTPTASDDGQVVAHNLLHGNEKTVYNGIVPSVVFTIPPVASVGIKESDAKEQGLDYAVKQGDASGWYTYRRINEQFACYKVLVDKNTHTVLGAHVMGQHAEDIINLFALAIEHGITADQLKALPWAYPTHTSDVYYML